MNFFSNISYKKYVFGNIFLFIFSWVLLTACESKKKLFAQSNNDLSFRQRYSNTSSNEMYLLLSREIQELPKNGLEPVCEIHNQKMYLGNVQIYRNIAITHGSEYESLKLIYFPNANDPVFVFSDSIYDKYIQDRLRIYICEECNNRRNEIIVSRLGIQ
jgi:hypothetical protein